MFSLHLLRWFLGREVAAQQHAVALRAEAAQLSAATAPVGLGAGLLLISSFAHASTLLRLS